MTIAHDTTSPDATVARGPVALDLYRDVHKGIRAELFRVTTLAGRTDPGDRGARALLAGQVTDLVAMLVSHAEHEDGVIQPALEQVLPGFARQVAAEHETLELRMERLGALAAAALAAVGGAERVAVHELYLELAAFTGVYLAHQDLEERELMPALEAAVGVDAVVAMHGAIVGAIPPDEMARFLAVMIPAANVDDRAELLGGMRASAPAEAFAGVWGLTGAVLQPAEVEALARRLGMA